MGGDRVQRRIAAILAADVVGYSRLMGKDEEATLATLKAYREVVDKLIADHGGRIFGSAGDSVIAEFASPVEAVRCATEIQLAIHDRNVDVPEPNRMRLRIGINLGDIVVDGDNLMGDGVNVAARLESLAPPGGICVSDAIHTHVRDRLSLDFLDLGEHKVKNIARPVRAYRVPLASEERTRSPFRGLDAFDFDHAELFFGRSRAIAACTDRLEQLAASGRAFLLIYGMSGSGKSSLLRAGLLPALTRPGAVSGIALWRRCVIRPSEGLDAMASLAAGLLRDEALPELAEERSAADFTDLLRSAPERGVALIRSALSQVATAAGVNASQARLALAVDQMEELFTTEAEAATRALFVRLLAAFAGSGFTWVIGAIRADFFHRCGEIPGFSALKDGLANYELSPPTGPEIAQIIREPARAAGLRFEEDADRGHLEDVLQEAAVADPASLPLLEFVLDALYEAGREQRLLTFAAYRALGGLEGAIARRADEVVDALAPEVQEALPSVLRGLTTVRSGDETITARPAPLAGLAGSPAQTALVETLIAARLLVSDEDAEGHAVIRLAHEALLSRWPRARDIVNANRSFLETRARVQADSSRWLTDDRNPDLLLPPGKRLAEGEELLQSRREEIDDRTIAYIEASSLAQQAAAEKERQAERSRIETDEAAKRERLEREAEKLEHEAERLEHEAARRGLEAAAAIRLAHRTRIAAATALVLAIGAGGGAFVGFRGQQEAIHQAERAEENASRARAAATQALEAKDQALRNQSLSLAFLSQQTAVLGDTEAAILLALEVLPKDVSTPERPLLFEAEVALTNALSMHRQIRTLRHDAGVTYAAFNPAGDRIVTSSFDKTARVWNVEDGSEITILKGHQAVLETAMFSPDGRHIITAAHDGTARVWDAETGGQIFVLHQPGDVHTALFSPDGTQVLTQSYEGTETTVWDARTGIKLTTLHGLWTDSAAFSPDGRTIATAQGFERAIHFWKADDGTQIKRLLNLTWPNRLVFSPDGTRLLIISRDSSGRPPPSRLWNVATGAAIATLHGHKSDNVCSAFSHDGRVAATVTVEGMARLWDGATGELRRVLGEGAGGLMANDVSPEPFEQGLGCAFSPDDRLIATASLHGVVRIWDTEDGSQFAIIPGDGSLVRHVAFSPDGSRFLTASRDGTARLWDIDGVLTTSLAHDVPPSFAIFSPDGAHLITGGGNRLVHLWDVASGREVAKFETHSGPVQHAAFSPDSHYFVTASQDGSINMFDSGSEREVARFEGDSSAVHHVQFSPDGQRLLSLSVGGVARLWDVASGAEVATFKAGGALRKALFSPDGTLVLTTLSDGTARIWKTDGTEVRVLASDKSRISAASFSPDGRLVATGSFDGTARVWSLVDGNVAATLKGHRGAVNAIEFSRDGQSVITASRDGTARIWSVTGGVERAILKGHRGNVTEAALSPSGLYAVTASPQDRTVRLWSANTGRQIAVLSGQEKGENVDPVTTHATFNSDGTRLAIISGDKVARIIRVFPTPQELIDYARTVVPRELTPCERRRFFLPVEGDVGECPE